MTTGQMNDRHLTALQGLDELLTRLTVEVMLSRSQLEPLVERLGMPPVATVVGYLRSQYVYNNESGFDY